MQNFHECFVIGRTPHQLTPPPPPPVAFLFLQWPRKYNPETKKNERYNFPGWLEWLEPPLQYRPTGTMDEEMAEAVSNLRLDDIAADTNRENDNVPADNNREDEEDPSDDDMGVDDDFDDGYAGDEE